MSTIEPNGSVQICRCSHVFRPFRRHPRERRHAARSAFPGAGERAVETAWRPAVVAGLDTYRVLAGLHRRGLAAEDASALRPRRGGDLPVPCPLSADLSQRRLGSGRAHRRPAGGCRRSRPRRRLSRPSRQCRRGPDGAAGRPRRFRLPRGRRRSRRAPRCRFRCACLRRRHPRGFQRQRRSRRPARQGAHPSAAVGGQQLFHSRHRAALRLRARPFGQRDAEREPLGSGAGDRRRIGGRPEGAEIRRAAAPRRRQAAQRRRDDLPDRSRRSRGRLLAGFGRHPDHEIEAPGQREAR